jgi:teichuronic acid biosynthesis glycosyltransferase TuaC
MISESAEVCDGTQLRALRSSPMKALVVSNMKRDAAHPERGRFVRDQVAALRELQGLQVELLELSPGPRALARGLLELRRRCRGERFNVVHAHFSLSALPALGVQAQLRGLTLHGTDVTHPRTRIATRAVLPLMDLVVAVSGELAAKLPGRAARTRAQVIPCGVDLGRFHPIPRTDARARLGLAPDAPQLLFAADPSRPAKGYAHAVALADAVKVPLITLGGVDPERVPLFVNAANAVLVPSAAEGFGLAVLEALACEVPVLATPVGVHEAALNGIAGTLCAPFELERWRRALRPYLEAADPRIDGRNRAAEYSATTMARRLADAWRAALRSQARGDRDQPSG